jgi:hypothetical protein
MEEQVKSTEAAEAQLEKTAKARSTPIRRRFSQRGRRYSPALKAAILKSAEEGTISGAAKSFALFFNRRNHYDFAIGPTATLTRLLATDDKLVNFDSAF